MGMATFTTMRPRCARNSSCTCLALKHPMGTVARSWSWVAHPEHGHERRLALGGGRRQHHVCVGSAFSGCATPPSHDFKELRAQYEPWFQGWLVLAPIGVWQHHPGQKPTVPRLESDPRTHDSISAQQAREMGLNPPDWSGRVVWAGGRRPLHGVLHPGCPHVVSAHPARIETEAVPSGP